MRAGALIVSLLALAEPSLAQDCAPEYPGEIVVPNACGTQMALADVDGDSRPDVVAPWYYGIAAWLWEAPGVFAQPPAVMSIDGDLAGPPHDWNKDGYADFPLVTGLPNAALHLALGSSAGTFSAGATLPLATYAVQALGGDWDGDGISDLLVVASDHVQLSIGVGGGALKQFPSQTTSAPSSRPLAGDVDGDGDLDFVSLHTSPRAFLNDGSGHFVTGPLQGSGGSSDAGVLADFDGDGDLDLAAVRASTGQALIHHGNAQGGLVLAATHALGAQPFSIASGDMDEDGRDDLVVLTKSPGSVRILRGDGQGAFTPLASTPLDYALGVVHLADLDGDGHLDLASLRGSSSEGCVGILLGDGNGGFEREDELSGPFAGDELARGDLNGDGIADVIALDTSGGRLSTFLGDGAGGWTLGGTAALGGACSAVATADVDHDGRDDALVTMPTLATLAVLLSTGQGQFAAALSFPAGSSPSDVTAGDFDLDGHVDLAVSHQGGARVFAGNGTGSFVTAAQLATTPGATSIASGDIDGDGWLDLALTSALGNDVSLAFGGPLGFTLAPYTMLVAWSPLQLELVDADGDGKLDLVVADNGLHAITLWLGDGAGSFALASEFLTGNSSPFYPGIDLGRFALGDIDADGLLDLVVPGNGALITARQRSSGAWQVGPALSVRGGSLDAVVIDVDRDGRLDLATVASQDYVTYALRTFRQTAALPAGYCTGKANSLGCVASIGATDCSTPGDGTPFWITASGVLNHVRGLLLYGFARNAAPHMGGTLCVAQPLQRTPWLESGGNPGASDCSGAFALDFDRWIRAGLDPALVEGAVVRCQFWYRDAGDAFGSGASDALEFALRH